jgi:hypothetical protein
MEALLKGSNIDLQKGGTNMVTKEKKQNAAKHSDYLIWVVRAGLAKLDSCISGLTALQ